MLLESQGFSCPWCGESNELPLDPDEAGQTVIQDCAVCCAPVEIHVPTDRRQPPGIAREGE